MFLRKEINMSDGQLLMIFWSMISIFLQMLLRKEINVSDGQLLMISWPMVKSFLQILLGKKKLVGRTITNDFMIHDKKRSANVTTERN